jgi:hypothetical protein
MSIAALRDAILAAFQQPIDMPLDDQQFDRLAREVFAFQFEHNAPYRRYCERRQVRPATLQSWAEIPPAPTAAFKEIALVAGAVADAQAVFRTSGTTRGAEQRGTHYILDLALYHQSLLPNFQAHLLPEGKPLPLISLIPKAASQPDSSLSHMIAVVADQLASSAEYFVDPAAGLDAQGLKQRLRAAEGPVLITGTSFAFVHFLDELRAGNDSLALPPGSRLMDTGGFKGRSRIVPAQQLRADYQHWLGIPETHAVNEYGMTELCSQFYDAALRAGTTSRIKVPPPWVRSRVVDPETLRPLPPGATGILQHFDLANLYSVLAVQTEDLARAADHGFELLGRAEGAVPRGCSIAMDLLLQSQSEA